MVNSLVEMPPRDFHNVLHSSIWWSSKIQLIGHGFSLTRARTLHKKGLRCVDDTWDMEHSHIILWREAHERYGLLDSEEEDWDLITCSIMHEWHDSLEGGG